MQLENIGQAYLCREPRSLSCWFFPPWNCFFFKVHFYWHFSQQGKIYPRYQNGVSTVNLQPQFVRARGDEWLQENGTFQTQQDWPTNELRECGSTHTLKSGSQGWDREVDQGCLQSLLSGAFSHGVSLGVLVILYGRSHTQELLDNTKWTQ